MRPGPDHRWLLTQPVIHALRDGLRFTADPIPDMPGRYTESPWIRLIKSIVNTSMDPIYDLPEPPDHPWQGWDYWCNPIFFGGWTPTDRITVERVIRESMVEDWPISEWYRQAREEHSRWVAEHVDAAVRSRLSTKYGSPTAA